MIRLLSRVVGIAVVLGGCALEDRDPVGKQQAPDPKVRLEKMLPLVIADGGLARTVRAEGLSAIGSRMSPDIELLWPGGPPLRGSQEAEYGVSQSVWADSSEFYWQPLLLRIAPGLGLAAGVLTASGAAVSGGDLEIGRYLAAWKLDSATSQLAALMVTQLPLQPMQRVALASHKSPDKSLPEGLSRADSAFRDRLEADGPAVAFPEWYAEDGLGFGNGGPLALGPEGMAQQLGTVSPATHWQMVPQAWGSSTDGSLAWVSGSLMITSTAGEAKGTEYNWNYILFWHREDQGYRIIAAATNPAQ